MSDAVTNRYSRQEGLIHQDRVENLRVGIHGSNPLLEEELSTISLHLGVKEFPVENDIDVMIVIDSTSDICHSNPLFVQMRKTGFALSTELLKSNSASPCDLLAPGLSTLAAAMTWQEILKREGCLRVLPIVKKYATVQFRIDSRFSQLSDEDISGLQAHWADGERLALFHSPCEDGTGHIRLSARLDVDSPTVRQLLDAVELGLSEFDEVTQPFSFEFSIPRIERLPQGNLVVAGVGGLGTWSMHTLIRGIKAAEGSGKGLDITVFDPDDSVEVHNLNRQVLYDETHLNRSKAVCAGEILSKELPKSQISYGMQSLGLPELDVILNEGEDTAPVNDSAVDLLEEFGLSDGSTLPPDEVKGVLQDSNLILCGVDNLHARGVLSAIASHLNVPFINAGAENFSGQFDLFNEPGCMACRYGPASVRDRRIASCQEDGEIPVASIVTTTAIFGALQGLATLTALSEPAALSEWPKQLTWGGQSNRLRSTSPPNFMSGDDHVQHILDSMHSMASGPAVKVDIEADSRTDDVIEQAE
jgi:molybdopterin/thiamine biosynthesis adenylyltransferase